MNRCGNRLSYLQMWQTAAETQFKLGEICHPPTLEWDKLDNRELLLAADR